MSASQSTGDIARLQQELRGELCDPRALTSLVQEGDIAALGRLMRCFGGALMRVGRKHCRSEADADDAVQDALLAAGENLDAFRGEGSIEGWLVRMVINACRRMQRGRKNDPALHDSDAELAQEARTPESGAQRSQLAEQLEAALLTLSPTEQTLILWAEAYGWQADEIAAQLGLSPGAVRTRLSRIRSRLRELLENVADDVT